MPMFLGSIAQGVQQGIESVEQQQARKFAREKQAYDFEQQRMANARALQAEQSGGAILGQMFAPPPVADRGPMPPAPGQPSVPAQQQMGPQPQIPNTTPGQPAAPAIPPYQTVQSAGQRAAQMPPAGAQPQGAGMVAPPSVAPQQAPQQQPQFTLQGAIQAMQAQGVPQDQWMGQLERLKPYLDMQQRQELAILQEKHRAAAEARQEKTAQSMIDWRQSRMGGGGAGGAGTGAGDYDKMSPGRQQTIDFYAERTLAGDNSWRTGLSRSKQGAALILQVEERVPQLAKEQGIGSGDVIASAAQLAADQKALKGLVDYGAKAGQFSRVLENQIGVVEQYMPKGVAGDTPIINKGINKLRDKIVGDPDLTAFENSIVGLAREHARFVTGLTSNAQLTASATKTADGLLNNAMNSKQIRAAMEEIRKEKDAAIKANKEETAALKGRISKGYKQEPAAAGGGSGWTDADEARLKELEAKVKK